MQLAYSLNRLGVDHAALSADDAPGGMFRKWPLFQRLLSWTKPYTGFQPGSRDPISLSLVLGVSLELGI